MKKLSFKVLYFHDCMTNEEEIQEEIRRYQREFYLNQIEINKIEDTDMPPFGGNYDILLFDWGGMSVGNSVMESFCREILEEAIEKPSKIYIMVSSMTSYAMQEAMREFKDENGNMPSNVFLTITEACRLLA
ncbi:hypothetical protein M0Q97_12130 [Candidatus Dojkabacteria bacterium]|jgi:hypothetical protein|nr:hypothetical protein [Candidatus Dojkabacteria bacterium]